MTITAFVNLKGGCGKSTAAVHLARYLLSKKKKVCLVDADAQETSSHWIHKLQEDIPRPCVERILDYDELIERLDAIDENFDDVVVDGAGGIADIQRAILVMADLVLVPVRPTSPDLDAAIQTARSIAIAEKARRGDINAKFFISCDRKTKLAGEVRDVLGQQPYPLLGTAIQERAPIADAMGQGVTLFDYTDKQSKAIAAQYRKLFQEAMKNAH